MAADRLEQSDLEPAVDRQAELEQAVLAAPKSAHGGKLVVPVRGGERLEQAFDEVLGAAGGDDRAGVAGAQWPQHHVMMRLRRHHPLDPPAGGGMEDGGLYHTLPAPGV